MTWHSTLISFVIIMFVSSPNFDGHPKISRVLKTSSFFETFKLGRIWEITSDEDWERIVESYDYRSWSI